MKALVKVSLGLLVFALCAPAGSTQGMFGFTGGAAATDTHASDGRAAWGSQGSVNLPTSDVRMTENNQAPESQFGFDYAYVQAPSNTETSKTRPELWRTMTEYVPSPFENPGKVQNGLLGPFSNLQFGDMRRFSSGRSIGATDVGMRYNKLMGLPSAGLSPCNGYVNITTNGYF